MPNLYNVTLVNLSADARAVVADGGKVERRGVNDEDMRRLLENFCAIDPVENAAADPEIRVQVKGQSCLVQAGHKKLIFYDVLNRDAPGHLLTVDQVMAELDGSALARTAPALAQALAAGSPAFAPRALPERVEPRPNVARIVTLAASVIVLTAAWVWLHFGVTAAEPPAGFQPLPPAEAEAWRQSVAGVYLTGTEPGQHGIVLSASGEARLIELRATDAPRIVHVAAQPGRVGDRLWLATDQPGGAIALNGTETLVYCNETYRRVR